jgi:hypothetical protein
MDGHQSIVGLRVGGTINEDRAAILRLAGNILRKTDMTVLLVSKSDSLAGRSLQAWTDGIGLEVLLGL